MPENQIPQGETLEESKTNLMESNQSPKGPSSEDVQGLVNKKNELHIKLKRATEMLKAEQEKNEANEQAKLEAAGKLNEVVDKVRAEKAALAEEFTNFKATVTHNALMTAVTSKAAVKGMNDPNDALNMVGLDGLGDIVDHELNVNSDAVDSMLEELKKTKPYLFKSASPQVRDGVPVQSPSAQPGAPRAQSLNDLTDEQWRELMVQKIRQERGQ